MQFQLVSERDSFAAHLKPRLVPVGSVPEGTQVGLGNELDLMMKFDVWENEEAPFTLDTCHIRQQGTGN